ncbi:hypothetical protein ABGB18_42640 [Nonomuraea sp. B12E4]|uniref:hypothetical protein n=1 Tax=Nonomuraea sp. B12E4 TaxID=3153564 RepID=UPI00325E67A7
MALDKTFASGEILSAANVNGHLLGLWIPIDKRVIPSGSPTTPITFSSLDSNFRLFRLTYHTISTGSTVLRLNNDSGTNYTHQALEVSSTTVVGTRLTSATGIDVGRSTVNTPVQGELLISKFSTASEARITGHTAIATHAGVQISLMSSSWNNAASLINRIDIIGSGAGIHGVVALEGMRGS